MLSNSEDIFKSFLYGIRKSDTSTIKPDKFVRIWNDWALKDWKNTNHFYDLSPEMNKIIRDKLQNLIRLYILGPTSANKWIFLLPDGVITSFTMPASGSGGSTSSTVDSSLYESEVMPKYARHLSAQFKLDYDTNSSQECSLTGYSQWLDGVLAFNDDISVYRKSYYLKPSDERIYYKIADGKIYVDNGYETQPYQCLLEYLKDLNQMSYAGGTFTYDIDLTQEQLQEVVDSAVRIHLENLTSPRYQSFLNEDKLRSQ